MLHDFIIVLFDVQFVLFDVTLFDVKLLTVALSLAALCYYYNFSCCTIYIAY